MTTKITNLLGKEQMSVYDVGKFLKQTGEFFQDMDLSPLRILDEATTDAEKIVDTIKRAVQRIVSMQDDLNEAQAEMYDALDKTYTDIVSKRSAITNKLEDLKPLYGINVPFDIKHLIDIAERFRNLDDIAWQRVIELAKALRMADEARVARARQAN